MARLGYVEVGANFSWTGTHTFARQSDFDAGWKVASSQATDWYNTADETTNYERVRASFVGNVFTFASSKGGTGTTIRNFAFDFGSGLSLVMGNDGLGEVMLKPVGGILNLTTTGSQQVLFDSSGIEFAGVGAKFNDSLALKLGNSSDVNIQWQDGQTNDGLVIGVGADGTANRSGNVIVCELGDIATNWGLASNSYPSLHLMSADQATPAKRLTMYHDGTEAVAKSFSGILRLDAPVRIKLGTDGTSLMQLPVHTAAQRDGISASLGDLIFNSTVGGVQVYDGSEWDALAGSAVVEATGTESLSWTVNSDATTGIDEDPSLVLIGGDGVASPNNDLVKLTWIQDSSAEESYVAVQRNRNGAGYSNIATVFGIGTKGATTDADPILRFHGGTGAAAATADVRFDGSTDKLMFENASEGYVFDDDVLPVVANGPALGSTALPWADLFLGDGGVINFSNGQATIVQQSPAVLVLTATEVQTVIADNKATAWEVRQGSNQYFAVDTVDGSELVKVGNATTNPITTFYGSGLVKFTASAVPVSNDGAALGSATLSWSDAFLASGAVVNFANGNVTLTHSSGKIATSGHVVPSTASAKDLGEAATPWRALYADGLTGANNMTWDFAAVAAGAAGKSFTGTGGAAGAATGGGAGGIGGAWSWTAGTGGAATTTVNETAGAGGAINITGGTGGAGAASVNGPAAGGLVIVSGGAAGAAPFGGANGGGLKLRGGAKSGTGADGDVWLGDTNTNDVLLGGSSAGVKWSASTGSFSPQATGAQTLGTTGAGGLYWSGLYLKSTATIDFNNGNAKILHSTNSLEINSQNGSVGIRIKDNQSLAFEVKDASGLNYIELNTTDGTESLKFGTNTTNPTTTFIGTGLVQFTAAAVPVSNDGAALGSTTLSWSDLFLASGAVLNWANGDAAMTHSAGNVSLTLNGTPSPSAGVTGAIFEVTGTITEAGSGNHAILAGVILNPPTITGGVATVSDTATLMIVNSPNATVSGRNRALWVDSGLSEFGGDVTPDANDVAALGTATLGWSDLYLASGGIAYFGGTSTKIDHAGGTSLAFTASNVLVATFNGSGTATFNVGAHPSTNDGAGLGTASLSWSDLFLASGAVINFATGDVTITHALNALAFAGATNGYTFDQPVLPVSNDATSLGSSAIGWSDLWLASGAVIDFSNGNAKIIHSANSLEINSQNGSVGVRIKDNQSLAFEVKDASGQNYIELNTTDGTETLKFGNSATNPKIIFGTGGAVVVGTGEGGSPSTGTLRGPNAVGTNVTAGFLAIRSGLGTGTGFTGEISLYASVAKQASGTSAHTDEELVRIGYAQNAHPSTTRGAFGTFFGPTWTDENTAASGTAAVAAGWTIISPVFAARNTSVTTTTAASLRISGAPTAGTNMTIGTALSLWVDAGLSAFGGNVVPDANDVASLGTSTLGWSDLYLASGGTINFAGTATQVYSSGETSIVVKVSNVTVATFNGSGTTAFSGTATPSVNDGSALGTTSLSWADLFLASGAVVNFGNGQTTLTHAATNIGMSMYSAIAPGAGIDGYCWSFTGQITEAASGNHSMLRGVSVSAPTIVGGVGTVTDTVTLYVAGAMSATVSGRNKSFWVETGLSEFGGDVTPDVNDVAALGTTALSWSDLFLASGGVINWANSDARLVHSSGALEFFSKLTVTIPDNTSQAFRVTEAGSSYFYIDTTNGSEKIVLGSTFSELQIEVKDNSSSAIQAYQGGNAYLVLNTTDGSESFTFGNATTNPAFSFAGSGKVTFTGRSEWNQGADVTSAGDLTLGTGNVFEVTGTTTINAITILNWQAGSVVVLTFAASVTVSHNVAGGAGTAVILLSGAGNFSATAGDTLTLCYCEQGGVTAWREIARTVI